MKYIALILLSIACYVNMEPINCKVIKCVAMKDSKNCVELVDNIYNFTPCSDKTKMCIFPDPNLGGTYPILCTPKSTEKITDLIDKKTCSNSEECASKTCTSSACVGKAVDATCASDKECITGTSCQNGACKNLLAKDVTCSRTLDCAIGLVCSTKCVSLYSLAAGEITKDPSACASGKTKVVGQDIICVNEKLKAGEACSETKDECTYVVTGKEGADQGTASYKCQCSWNYKDKKYCPGDSSDANYVKLIEAYKAVTGVHTVERSTISNKIKNAADIKFKDVDQCIIDFFGASSFLKFSVIALIGLFLF